MKEVNRMPNHVRTVIKFKNLKQKDIEKILNSITRQMEDDIYPLNCIIDFDKIIPEPTGIEECPEDCILNEKSCVSPDPDKPWFDWYTWHNKYWNTKWNAYDTYTKIGKSYIVFVFSTAWSPAVPIFEKLAELEYDMEIRWADEDYGSNCGKMIYFAEDNDWGVLYENTLADPERYAEAIWRKY